MKKIISVVIVLSIMMASLFSAFSFSTFATVPETVNLDNTIFFDQENWVADTQWHPTTMTKANGLLTFKANNAGDFSTIDPHIGYQGRKFSNETLKITAKIDNTVTWFTMILRSSNALNNIFNGDKYMIYFSGQGVSLMRINGNANTDLGSKNFASPVDFTAENVYSLSAVNDTANNKVIVTVQINDIAAVTFEDTSANRLTADGYFGAGMYESATLRTMTLGKTVNVTIPSDLAVKELDKMVDDKASWSSNEPASVTNQNGYIKAKGISEIAFSNSNAKYADANIALTAKMNFTLDSAWIGLTIRAKLSATQPYIKTNECYFFAVSKTAVTLYRQNLDKDLVLLKSQPCTEFADGNAHITNLISYNGTDGVVLAFKVDGNEKLSYIDISSDKITNEGYFTGFAYTNNELIIGSGITSSTTPPTTTVKTENTAYPSNLVVQDIDKMVDDTESWSTNDATSVKKQNGYISAKGLGEIAFSNKNAKYADANILVTAKMNFTSDKTWIGLVIRAKLSATQPYIKTNECYFFAVSKTSVTLYRQNLNKELSTLKVQPCTEFANGKAHSVNLISYNGANGVVLAFKVDGIEKLSYTDNSGDKITKAGFFTGFAYTNNELIIGKGKTLPSTPIVEVSGMAAKKSNWTTNSVGSITATTTEFKVQGSEAVAGYSAKKFGDATFKFDFKTTFVNKDWVAIGFRNKVSNAQAWHPDNQGYLMIIRNDSISVIKYVASKKIAEQYLVTVPLSTPVGSIYHNMELTTVNSVDGVRIILKYDGNYIIDYVDKVDPIKDDGYFSLMGFSGNAITLRANPNVPEPGNDNPTTSDNIPFLPVSVTLILLVTIFFVLNKRKFVRLIQFTRKL